MIVIENGDLIEGDATNASEVDYTIHGLDNNTLTQLSDGQLPGSKGTLYTSNSSDVITSVIFVNDGAAHNHVNLYLKPSGGTSRRLIAKDLQLESGYSLHFDGAKVQVLGTIGAIVTTGLQGSAGVAGSSGTSGLNNQGTPQNVQISNYTTVLSDQGKHILYPGTCGTSGTGRTWTIDSNANVEYPIGSDITFVNQGSGSAGTISILVTDDTLTLFSKGTSGTRSLAPYGIATALKIDTTKWLIAGVGIT